MKPTHGINFTNISQAVFLKQIQKVQKGYDDMTVFFVPLVSLNEKAVHKHAGENDPWPLVSSFFSIILTEIVLPVFSFCRAEQFE